MIDVLIVEDDPMVAELNKRYLENITGFQLIGIASSVKQAVTIIECNHIDLILLDLFMPESNGLDLLHIVRSANRNIDVILITAASDMDTIQNAMRFGIIDYLIKPFTYERLYEALSSYKQRKSFMGQQHIVTQKELDQKIFKRENVIRCQELPKGLTKATLKVIVMEIQEMKDMSFDTEILASKTGITRVSVRKYLKFLEEIKVIESKISYGSIGRPNYEYLFKEGAEDILSSYY